MTSQKHLFDLPEDIHYLNAAYMSPQMKAVEEAGIKGMKRKSNPALLFSKDFFSTAEEVREKFGEIINCDPLQVAIIPSVSYGLKSVINNIPVNNGDHAITVSDEFPSGYYTLQDWCKKNKKALNIIEAPQSTVKRGETWNNKILEAINENTSVVLMSSIHWTDGTMFNLAQIGEKCKKVNATFIVDGSQSVGALPIDVMECKIDALICAGYKWLMGPYSMGLAYYNKSFNNGTPVEDAWINRSNARDFTKLTRYVDTYSEGAARYNVGEHGNFIHLPMLDKALEQLLEWKISSIQDYCKELIQPLLKFLEEKGYWVEEEAYRTNHVFGFLLPPGVDRIPLLEELQSRKVIVSVRGDAIRVSTHLYNTAKDIDALIEILNSKK